MGCNRNSTCKTTLFGVLLVLSRWFQRTSRRGVRNGNLLIQRQFFLTTDRFAAGLTLGLCPFCLSYYSSCLLSSLMKMHNSLSYKMSSMAKIILLQEDTSDAWQGNTINFKLAKLLWYKNKLLYNLR